MNCDAVIDKPVLTYSVLPPCFEFLGGCKTIHPILSHRHPVCPVLSLCLSCVCDVGLLWANGCTNQGETWHASRPRSWPHCVRWGPSSPSPKRGRSPQHSAYVCCGQMAAWIKIPLGMEVGLGPSVLDGNPAPLSPKRRRSLPNFRPTFIVAKRLDGSRWYLARRWASVQVTLC